MKVVNISIKRKPKYFLDVFIIRLYGYLGLNNQMINHYLYVTNDLEFNFDRYFKIKVKK